MRYLIAIPAYNAARHLAELIQRVQSSAPEAAIVIVNDGSQDNTIEIVSKTAAILINHEVNKGKGEALKTAFTYASQNEVDAVVQMDADLQHEPESLPLFFQAFEQGNGDVIIGARSTDKTVMPDWSRRMSNRLCTRIVSWIGGHEVFDSQCGYRLLSRHVIETIHPTRTGYAYEPEFLVLAARAGFKIGAVPIRTVYQDETSYIHPWRDTWRFTKTMVQLLVSR